jgi:tripartite-type tricarboxylate transporter receptor subunit TctC
MRNLPRSCVKIPKEKMKSKGTSSSVWLLTLGFAWLSLVADRAHSQTPYYQGKTITIVRGGEPGGTGDLQTRALIPFLEKYLPGRPKIVISNMPGAAGRKAANHIYATAKPDGLTIGAVGAGLVVGPILGLTGTLYDLDRLIYLGSTESGDPYFFLTRKEAGLDTLEKLRAASGVRIGAQGVGHPIFVSGRMFAYLLGLKEPKMVVGYGGLELDVAFDRGEIDARATGADTILQRDRESLVREKFSVHSTITIPKGKFHPLFPNAPELETFARNDKERQLLDLFRTFIYPRWPYILPPGTPNEIVTVLRGAMAKSFKDPEFHKEFKKLMANDPTPLTGEELQSTIKALPRDPEIVGLYKKLAEDGPLPPR